jgi:hypothetical protein
MIIIAPRTEFDALSTQFSTHRNQGKVQQPKTMFDTPFTNINDQDMLGVFGEQENRKIVETLRQINKNADVA